MTCIGNGIIIILGTPGGRQFRIGSSESGVARGPYPGLTLLYLSAAQGWNGGSSGLNVIEFWRSIQTPEKSRGENPVCAAGSLRFGAVCVKATTANTTMATSVRLGRIPRPRHLPLECPSKFPVTAPPRNTRTWRLPCSQFLQLITTPSKLRATVGETCSIMGAHAYA